MSETTATIWRCFWCDWECEPDPDISLAEAECDNCGEPLEAVDTENCRKR